jgi:hypothetical protein
VLPDRLNARIAETISNRIDEERASADTASPAWRERCEIAKVAMLGDSERRIFLSHVAVNRGSAVASDLELSAGQMRMSAISFLARKPS